MQLAQEVSVLYSSTVPGYSRHIADMLRQAEFTNINFPGNQQDTSIASPGSVRTSHAFQVLQFIIVGHLVCRLRAMQPCLGLTVPSTHRRYSCVLAGSTWDQEAILMAQDALQVRYGFTTDDQKQRSLQQALQNLPSICC